MEKTPHLLSNFRLWILASRPKTLPAAAAPVIVGSALAWNAASFRFLPGLAALLAALLLQIGANFANDVFDYYRGADARDRLGPTRVTQSGLFTPHQVIAGTAVVFSLAALLGVYLTFTAGWPVLIIGLASILAALAYTGGPFPFGYYGLGDLFVFIFFGLVAVMGTYFVHTRQFSPLSLWAAIPMGLLITAILVVNNLRDLETDRVAGKRTLAVFIGVRATRWEYALCLGGAYLMALLLWVSGQTSVWVLLSWFSIPLAIKLLRMIWQLTGRPLNQALAGTGRLTLIYAVLFSLGVVLSI